MTPHAPNLFALSAGVSPSCDTGATAEYHSGSTADVVDPTAAIVVDKKRARPPEEATRARKKVASELMAFEFESLSLSAPVAAPAPTDQVPTRPPPSEHPAAGQPQCVQKQQHHQQQEQQEHARQYPQYRHQAHQHLHQVTGESHRVQGHGVRARSFTTSSSSSSAASSSSSAPRSGRPGHFGSTHVYTHQDHRELMIAASTPPVYSAFSPPSPPISPLPSARPTNMDVSMGMDEGLVDRFGASPSSHGNEATKATGTPEVHTSNVRTLNLRQRKWNSARKEWQEWHDVQATHASDTAPTTHILGASTTIKTGSSRSAGPETDTSAPFQESSMIHIGVEAQSSNSNEAVINGSSAQCQSSGLGRQRSLNEARGKSNVEPYRENTQEEQRTPIGARARSYSETHIHPFTQPPSHPQQLDPYSLPASEQVDPSLERNRYFSSQVTQQHPSHTGLPHPAHSPQLTHRHPGHPPRHHSDNVYSAHGDLWDRNSDGETGLYMRHSQQPHTQLQQPRPGQLMMGSGLPQHHQQQHPWNVLSMTALDGTVNISSDRFARPALGSSPTHLNAPPVSPSAMVHLSPTSPLSPPNSRHEDAASWNQQLLKSQKEYRETLGGPRLGFGPANTVPYGQHQHAQSPQQHGQEDVSMGEEAVRQFPSRSSSPSPCLSMAPTITRPLSISFSQLAGSNMLGHLAEHEHDDDMEL
ncbi:unnamed protein product [Mortierella alpina]